MTNPAIVEVVVPGKQGAPGLTPRGAWNGVANYVVRDVVTHGNRLWIALAASTNVVPGTDPLKWDVMIDAPALFRDFLIDDGNPLTDALPAALKVNIDAAGGGDATSGGVGEFLRLSLDGNVVARLGKTGAMALAGMLAIGAVDGAGTGPALKGNGAVLEARLDDDSGLTSMRSKGYEAHLGTITAQATGLDISAAWNHAAIAGPLIRANVVDSLSDVQALLIDLRKDGVSQIKVDKNGNATLAGQLTATGTVYTTTGNLWAGSNDSKISLGSAADVALARDASNILAQRNGASAQAFRVYNTFVDVSNFERGFLQWSGNLLELGTEAAGTGSARSIRIKPTSGASILFAAGGFDRWQLSPGGDFLAATDNVSDIGSATLNRPRTVYAATSFVGGAFIAESGSAISWASRSRLASPSDGVMTLWNSGQTSFSILQFGGTTASFPALKRNGPDLDARLADDSGYATMNLRSLRLGGTDVVLERDAAAQLALRNGSNPQRLHVYNTFVDAANYERMLFGFVGNIATIDVSAAGTGTQRKLEIRTGSGYTYSFTNAGTPSIDATALGAFLWPGRAAIMSSGAGIINLWNHAATDFGRLTFGGTTSAAPAIKKSSAILQARLADDSGFTSIQGKLRSHANAVSETPTATHTIAIEDASGTAYKVLALAA